MDGEDKSTFVVIDFGMATKDFPAHSGKDVVGSVPYCAPEMLDASSWHGPEVDIWGCGVVDGLLAQFGQFETGLIRLHTCCFRENIHSVAKMTHILLLWWLLFYVDACPK